MKFLKTLLIFGFIALIFKPSLLAQYKEEAAQSGVGIPFFMMALHKQLGADLKHTQMLIMAEFMYDDLTFIKNDTLGYDADFELLAAVYNEKHNVVQTQTLSKKIHVPNFDLTNSRNKKVFLTIKMDLLPGKYQLFVKSTDINSNKNAQRKIDLNIQDFTKHPLFVSGLSFMKDATFDSSGNLSNFLPSFGNNFNLRSGHFYIYSDIYSAKTPEKIELRYLFSGMKGTVDLDTSIVFTTKKPITPVLFKVRKNLLKQNKYNLELTVKSSAGVVKKNQSFSFYWTEVPNTEADINAALSEMIYIMPEDSLDKYRKASLAEKKAFFKRFWKEHDPDPATRKNELKNEYFRRVNYANRQFSVMGQQGWLTDRGRILIKFGYPDDIERHPFELGTKPYEIWRYYSLRKIFVFEDETGFGDYRLDPAYLDMEFR